MRLTATERQVRIIEHLRTQTPGTSSDLAGVGQLWLDTDGRAFHRTRTSDVWTWLSWYRAPRDLFETPPTEGGAR